MPQTRCVIALVLLLCAAAVAENGYQKPSKAILDILDAPITPVADISPTGTHMLLADGKRYAAIAHLSQPMLRLAGLRINPRTNGGHNPPRLVSITIKDLAGGRDVAVKVPADAYLGRPDWSPDGKRFAFTNTTANRVDLWIADLNGYARVVKNVALNGAMEGNVDTFVWTPDSSALLVRLVPAKRGAPPVAPTVPTGPNVQESSGRPGPVRTFQDMLSNAHDEALFDYYATAQLALVDANSGAVKPVGQPGIFTSLSLSPDGRFIRLERVQRPYSYLHPVQRFPMNSEVWDRHGKVVYTVAKHPLRDMVPNEGVPTGPRSVNWHPTKPATLMWFEALDGGDPLATATHRDKVMSIDAPFTAAPREVFRLEQRLGAFAITQGGKIGLLQEYDRKRRWIRFMTVDLDSGKLDLISERNQAERYKNPGNPVMVTLPNGKRAVAMVGDNILMSGAGATPEGDRPFLDRLNLRSKQTERLYRSEAAEYEELVGVLTNDGARFITKKQSPTEPPNYYLRQAGGEAKAQTSYPDPAPLLRKVKKQLVKYKRADGVDLSFTLYLPPDYQEGTRLPTLVWAYPLEFTDPDVAGQVTGSPQRFTIPTHASHLFMLLEGYAILDNAAMPVIGDPDTVNNTYLEQVVANAKAAIDKAVELGVTDPERVAVGGHSYGAFMTANLLAHSDLFRAGIARSGAYNRTLTPFGFQRERRNFWEAQETYVKLSPFFAANKIKEPLLLIHGESDNNMGSFPIQSERMYQAIRGNGGTVRVVMLPHESHGYVARESVEHTIWEMADWLNRWVKNPQASDAPKKAD